MNTLKWVGSIILAILLLGALVGGAAIISVAFSVIAIGAGILGAIMILSAVIRHWWSHR